MQWDSLSIQESTWKDKNFILQQFPQIILEDKNVVAEGGNILTVTQEEGEVNKSRGSC